MHLTELPSLRTLHLCNESDIPVVSLHLPSMTGLDVAIHWEIMQPSEESDQVIILDGPLVPNLKEYLWVAQLRLPYTSHLEVLHSSG